jgi:cytochrome c oxidase accessory protein FixG
MDQDEKLAKLNMLDDHGHRLFIIPAEVKGMWKTYKGYVHTVLLLFFLILPWIQINEHQALLLDIPNRQFYFFGLHLLSHDAPLLFFIVFGLAILLAITTALWGRVWCGWACPQTVFIEKVFRQIEIWVEGSYIQRRKLRDQEMDFNKLKKVSFKWFLYFLVSSIMAHSFLAYFIGSEKLMDMIQHSPESNWTYFLLVSSCTALFLFNFGWFREQFCLIVCPYGKIQSLLMDSQSVAVMYDDSRTDCVQCRRCVQVCPTGIDIRNGLQMECINCTACIDACDEIMTKVNQPKGLIRYKAMTNEKINWFRPRVLIYSFIFLISIGGLTWGLGSHSEVSAMILRSKGLPYQVLEMEGKKVLQNQFFIRIHNNSKSPQNLLVRIPENLKLQISQNPISIPQGALISLPFFIHLDFQNLDPSGSQNVEIQMEMENKNITQKIQLVGPKKF